MAVRYKLTGNNLKETDFEEIKRQLQESEKRFENHSATPNLGSPGRFFKLVRSKQLETLIMLYEKWNKRGYDAELQRLREELKKLTS